ncbi:aminoglycoside phosphotransferase (APT) family kinase protein [Micromonospora pisi]|uniref:Aminoglycoside phosphotransferase (APT) family kinase protein n=1 Tax=Micromonospora pisi TaxID=589240 RepID=A0A495JDF1_9ACTN|nr:phosphotransferase [Micromonospora pisi]RKR86382.1 aminoglycoside phosphotransferase (APT) family kinase protein [Micromonospora pisi]
MRTEEIHGIATALGSTVVATAPLAGGYSHSTWLVTLTDGKVVARLGGPDPMLEAAVMRVARRYAPVPQVLLVVPPGTFSDGARPAMVIEHVAGTPLSQVLAASDSGGSGMGELGTEVGRVVAGISSARFDRPGFFTDEQLIVQDEHPWSAQLPEFAAACMGGTADARLDRATKQAWVDLCAVHAPALVEVDHHSRLVHSDINPKNILVSPASGGWRVDAVLDWEFSYSGCPYGDAANMARFGADYPARFLDGFRTAFAEHQPADLAVPEEWGYLGRVLDMFALSDLVTRPLGHPVADQAAEQIRHWIAAGVPRTV